jgi:O-antigen ligase
MGAAAALALPLAVAVAVRARSSLTSSLAAATVPVVALGLVLTLSRGGTIAAALGLLTAVLVVAPRLVLLRTMLAPAVGAGVLIAATLAKDPIREAVGGAAQTDAGSSILPLVVLVTVGVGLVQAGWNLADRSGVTPRLPRPSRLVGSSAATVGIVLLLTVALAAGAPDRISDGWKSFKNPDTSALNAKGGSVQRLTAANSAGRYEEWKTAIDGLRENPAGGIGLGSWEAWFNPRRDTSPSVRNAHSQPLEIAAETGVLGLALFAAIVLVPIGAGLAIVLRRRRRTPFAIVALPSTVGFIVVVSVDWTWQLSSVPVAIALLGATLLARDTSVPAPATLVDSPEAKASSPSTTRRRTVGRLALPLA